MGYLKITGLLVTIAVTLLLITKEVNAIPCAAKCDVQVMDTSQVKAKQGYIEADRQAMVAFNISLKNYGGGGGENEISASSSGNNFDCEMYFSSTDNSVLPANTDALDGETKYTFSDTKACAVANSGDMKNGLNKLAQRRLYGYCNMTLKESACPKANFICVQCKPPTGATYSADTNADNNRYCQMMYGKQGKVFQCKKAAHCLRGGVEYGYPKMARCHPAQKYCFNVTHDEMLGYYFGCTNEKKYCKGLKDCHVCDPTKSKDYCNEAGTVKFSIAAMLSAMIVSAFF